MKIHEFITILLLSLTLVGCESISMSGYLDDHPEFSPVVPRKGKIECQVTLVRSWKPTLHIKAYLESNKFEESQKAYIAYSFSEHSVKRLKKVEISIEKWNEIVRTVNNSFLWSYDNVCAERSYQQRAIFIEEGGACEEIVLTDGASLTIAASENARSKAISLAFLNTEIFTEYTEIPIALLTAIGKESLIH